MIIDMKTKKKVYDTKYFETSEAREHAFRMADYAGIEVKIPDIDFRIVGQPGERLWRGTPEEYYYEPMEIGHMVFRQF